MPTLTLTQWIRCAQCEEYLPPQGVRWFAEGMTAQDGQGAWVKLAAYETTSDDPAGAVLWVMCQAPGNTMVSR